MRCQGRPGGVCPDNRNDSTVHNTIADLFLCDACEEYRWPSDKSSKNTSTAASRPSRRQATKLTNNNKGKTKKVTQQDFVKTADATMELASAGTTGLQDGGVHHHRNHNDSACEDVCTVCNDSVTEDDHIKYIECSCCKHVYHDHCTGLSSDVFSVLLGIVSASGWVCHPCQQNVAGLHTALSKAAKKLLTCEHLSLGCMKSS